MATPPLNDPNATNARATDPTGRPIGQPPHHTAPVDHADKKSRTVPIIIGVIVLALLAWLLMSMLGGDDAETVPDTTQTGTLTAPVTNEPVPDPVVTEPAATPDTAETTSETISVEIGEPTDGAPTTTVPVQDAETPVN